MLLGSGLAVSRVSVQVHNASEKIKDIINQLMADWHNDSSSAHPLLKLDCFSVPELKSSTAFGLEWDY